MEYLARRTQAGVGRTSRGGQLLRAEGRTAEPEADARPGLKHVHSQVAQDVPPRLKKAMRASFRRLKAGENPGFYRFHSNGRFDSLTDPQWENGVGLSANSKRLPLSK
jgi:putative transposase